MEVAAAKFIPSGFPVRMLREGPLSKGSITPVMHKALFILVLIWSFVGLHAQALPREHSADPPPEHEAWDSLLRTYVSEDGLVDYLGFQRDKGKLQAYLALLSRHVPGRNWKRKELLAYFINLYNAGTVMLILEHLPLGSIRDIPRPWGNKFLTVGDQNISLSEIEHGILRKMDEPRIHFAINCASQSCPKLLSFAFTSATLESQLEKATHDFINDPERNRISAEKAALSRIFKWYRKDFTTRETSLIQYLNPYLPDPIPENTPVQYLPYDWSLNIRSE